MQARTRGKRRAAIEPVIHNAVTGKALVHRNLGSISPGSTAPDSTEPDSTESRTTGWRRHTEAFLCRMRADWRLRYPACNAHECSTRAWSWELLRPVWQRVWLADEPYCLACLPPILQRRFEYYKQLTAAPARAAHRIPLGLLLVSRGWLTPRQLRAGLGRQRRRGGKLGNALCELGYTGEDRIAAGLAMQWACPVLTLRSPVSGRDLQLVPRRLQELHNVIPVHYSEATRVLVLAFADGIDYGLMQAIGGMLDCRVEPCVATETQVRKTLDAPSSLAREPAICFERIPEGSDQSAIAMNYIQHWSAHTVRIAGCGRTIWARLQKPGARPQDAPRILDLLFDASAQDTAAA